ncbi:molecular chaperone DnaJ [Spiroplasma endosymbiont of Megaselia nigra]|uniref:molecular chaperone DnaJ n=1 Tax=Spiroplasma endosymbiont of Megaselia nigra TaxID=2478537 RepID=UPI000F88E441|nr:molecular chaperone DnaJ [Spiroplasma endosymbiont of Megaselia nigra]RUO86627.1 molecular chaperone DnaJ [Spiroplasma endosymbiont of Megaselia nigra]
MGKRDYYEVFGVNRNATDDEIKRAFRQLAKKYHPDVSKEKDAEAKFKEINEAYEVLSDPNKRRNYDQFSHAGTDPNGFGGFSHGFSSTGDFEDIFSGGFGGFGDIFENFFGGGKKRRGFSNQPIRGENISARVTLTLKEQMFGKKINLDLNIDKKCEMCDGTGAKDPKKDIHTCTTCDGYGYVNLEQRSIFGVIQSQQPCPDCKGRGKVITNKCSKCKGQGNYRGKETVEIELPKSIYENQQLRIREKGNYGLNNGSRGDIYLEISVKPNKYFKLVNDNLHLNLPVSYLDALLGAEIKVPTFDGDVHLKLPPNTKTNSIFNIPNHGFFKSPTSTKRGDLIVNVIVTIPTKLSPEEKTILQKLRNNSSFKITDDFYEDL